MEVEVKVWCSECGGEVAEKEDIMCDNCVQALKDEIADLTSQIDKQEKDIEAYEKELAELK